LGWSHSASKQDFRSARSPTSTENSSNCGDNAGGGSLLGYGLGPVGVGRGVGNLTCVFSPAPGGVRIRGACGCGSDGSWGTGVGKIHRKFRSRFLPLRCEFLETRIQKLGSIWKRLAGVAPGVFRKLCRPSGYEERRRYPDAPPRRHDASDFTHSGDIGRRLAPRVLSAGHLIIRWGSSSVVDLSCLGWVKWRLAGRGRRLGGFLSPPRAGREAEGSIRFAWKGRRLSSPRLPGQARGEAVTTAASNAN